MLSLYGIPGPIFTFFSAPRVDFLALRGRSLIFTRSLSLSVYICVWLCRREECSIVEVAAVAGENRPRIRRNPFVEASKREKSLVGAPETHKPDYRIFICPAPRP